MVSDVSADVLEDIISTRRRGIPPVPSEPLSAKDLSRLFDAMDSEGVTFTMAMFGEVAFTVQPRDDAEDVANLVRSKSLGAEPVVCDVDARCAAVMRKPSAPILFFI